MNSNLWISFKYKHLFIIDFFLINSKLRYSSLNTIENIGTIFLFIMILVGIAIILLLMKITISKTRIGGIIYNKLSGMFFFNPILTFLSESYLVIAISCLINSYKVMYQF